MLLLKGKRKLLLAAGLVSYGSALLWSSDSNGFKVCAQSVIQNHLKDYNNWLNKWDNNWDKREPIGSVKPWVVSEKDENNFNEKPKNTVPLATRHLLLIRHGQFNNKENEDQLRTLTPLGREQANELGQRLKDLSLPYTRIIQSTMTRATETAQIINQYLPNIPVQSCDFIREGLPIRPEPSQGWNRPEYKFFADEARLEAAFRKYFKRAKPTQGVDSYEIVVCHANVIRYFICRALQFPPEAWVRFHLHHMSMTWIAIKPNGRVIVYTVGDMGYMSPHKITANRGHLIANK